MILQQVITFIPASPVVGYAEVHNLYMVKKYKTVTKNY